MSVNLVFESLQIRVSHRFDSNAMKHRRVFIFPRSPIVVSLCIDILIR